MKPPLPPAGPAPGLWRLLLLTGLFMMLVQIHRSAGAVIANELGAQGLRPADVATVVAALFLASAVTQIPTGLAFDRYGARKTLFGAGLLAVAGIVLFALAEDTLGLAGARFLIGVGHGGVIAGIYLLALTWVSPARVATATGSIIAVAGGIGGLLATAPLLAALHTLGHQQTFLLIGLATLAVTLTLGLFVRDAPDGVRPAVPDTPETFVQSVRGLWEVAMERRAWPIYAMSTSFAAPFNAIGGLWSGPYLHDVHRFSAEQASVGVLCMVGAFHLGNLLYGHVERALASRKRTVMGGALAMSALLALLIALPGIGAYGAITVMVLFCLCAPFYPVLAAHCRGFIPLHRAGRAIACINLMGLTTVFTVQAVTGLLVELTADADGTTTVLGYRLVFATVLVVLLAGMAIYRKAEDVPP